MRAGQWVAMVAALAAMAGCATEKTGAAVGNGGGNGIPQRVPAASTSTDSSVALPPRPRQLDLKDVDPCRDVLTGSQLHQLAYDLGYQRAPQPGRSGINGGKTCTYSSSTPPDQPSRDVAALIVISTSEGVVKWLTDPQRRSSTEAGRQTVVEGFPALVIPNPSVVDNCAVIVDVHDDQYLQVDGSADGGVRGTSPDPYCDEAQRVAGMVIETLSARS
jgi:hypothetical protein